MTRKVGGFLAAIFLTGCSPVVSVGLKILYRDAPLPESQITRDICYAPNGDCNGSRRQLDFYKPEGHGWPVLIFVHGGGWNSGDKSLKVNKADVYANVGRFYAARGFGVAVINYGLQPTVTWDQQVADVEAAIQWARSNAANLGGKSDQIFLMGHSAGAYLVSLAALRLSQNEKTPYLRGVMAISGAALDLTDQKTYEMGERIEYYEQRFKGADTTRQWQKTASPVSYATKNTPPFLIVYGGSEKVTLQRQSLLLNNVLSEKGAPSQVLKVPGQRHSWMALIITRADKQVVPEILSFIERNKN